MRKTSFAGLTLLDPSDPLGTDGASFQSKNPDIIDRLLRVGTVTHRHDAHTGLSNPTAPPSATVSDTGGFLGPDIVTYWGYTLLDSVGGETAISPVSQVSTTPPADPPDAAPSLVVDYGGGQLLSDTYYYAITVTDGMGGETVLGPWGSVTREPGFASGRVTISGLGALLATSEGTIWRLWRAQGGGEFNYLASGSSDSFVDDGHWILDCGVSPPTPSDGSTTNHTQQIHVTMPPLAGISGFNLYCSLDGSFASPCLIGAYPLGSAGTTINFTDLSLLQGSPPDRNLSLPGASKIDPDTDLLDFSWKRAVAASAALPSGALGDARVVKDEGTIWVVTASGGTSGPSGWKRALLNIRVNGATQKYRRNLDLVASAGILISGTDDAAGDRTVITFTASGGGGGGGASGASAPTPLVYDPFDVAVIGDHFTNVAGTFSDIATDTGKLKVTATGSHIIQWTGISNAGDQKQVIKMEAGTTFLNFSMLARILDATNYVQVNITGTNMVIYKRDAGAFTNLASVAVTTAASTDYWVVFRVTGHILRAELWDVDPRYGGTPITTVKHILTSGNATKFGKGIVGGVGLELNPAAAGELTSRLDDWTVVTDPGRTGF